jgi:hypothetical protein
MPLIGTRELKEKLAHYRKAAPGALGAALYQEGVAIIEKADEDIPYEFGHLRRSHFVTVPSSEDPRVTVGYGAGYGLFVHEVPANHPKGGKDHFLRDAFNARMPGIAERLAKRIEANLASGAGVESAGVPSVQPDPMEAILAEMEDRRRRSRRARAAAIRAQNVVRGQDR